VVNLVSTTPKARAVVRRRTGGVSLRVPFIVNGEEHYVEVGMQVVSAPVDLFDEPTAAFRLRDAVGRTLTAPVPVRYGKGQIEEAKFVDILTDAIVTRVRDTM